MLTTLSLGVLASVATEAVTWINKKLSGTVLKGNGAFLLAAVVALIGGAFQVWQSGVPFAWGSLYTSFAQIWVISQGFFLIVVQTLNLDVSSTPTTVPAQTA